jgi:hypothetical protein
MGSTIKILLIAIAMGFTNITYSQDVTNLFIGGQKVDLKENKFVEIQIVNKPFSRNCYLNLDYGQERDFPVWKQIRLTNKSGDSLEFNSRMDALNFMINQGFVIQNSFYVNNTEDNSYVFTCLLMRK